MEFLIEELECSLQFEGESGSSLQSEETDVKKESELLFDGEIVKIMSPGIKSISINGTTVEPDQNQTVELPIDQTITAYLQQNLGEGLKLTGTTLSVDITKQIEENNTRPITSAAVYTELGNINALLRTI